MSPLIKRSSVVATGLWLLCGSACSGTNGQPADQSSSQALPARTGTAPTTQAAARGTPDDSASAGGDRVASTEHSSAGRSGAAPSRSSAASATVSTGNSGMNAAGHSGSAGLVAGNSGVTGGAGMSAAGADASAAGSSGSAGGAEARACAGPTPGSRGSNPLFSDVYTADPAALVDGCTFYIHCGHDEGPNSFVLREWFALSSTDMVHWDRKVAMRVSDFAWAEANAWAGQVVRKDGKYYWFAPVQERGGGMAIGVAVSDSATGPFHDAIGKPLINDAFEMSNAGFRQPSDTPFTIDPTVWIDDDGQAYLHYGGFSRMMAAKLTADLTAVDGRLQEVTPRGFFEAPYLIKYDDAYYEIYAAGANPATIDYSTSDSPFGPWTYRGRILDALPSPPGEDAATNHAAVAQFAGQWYIVYHLSAGPNGGGTYKREVAVDKLMIKPDGTIDKVTPSDGLKF